MKGIMSICVAAALFAGSLTGCKDGKGNGKGLRTDAMLAIRPAQMPQSVTSKANPEHLSALEIIKQAEEIIATPLGRRGFADDQRDTVNIKLLMYSSDIVSDKGELKPGWIESRDIIIVKYLPNPGQGYPIFDTIAYLPNATVIKAEKDIKAAYTAENYEACYTLFDQAFRFTPITGAEWRALKAQNAN